MTMQQSSAVQKSALWTRLQTWFKRQPPARHPSYHQRREVAPLPGDDSVTRHLALLPGVPLIDSPFFRDILATDYFTAWEKTIARDLHHKGYAVLDFPQDAFDINADVATIATNPTMLALLSKLYGRPAFPFQTLNFERGSQQHFHNDAVHFHSSPARFMCGVGVRGPAGVGVQSRTARATPDLEGATDIRGSRKSL